MYTVKSGPTVKEMFGYEAMLMLEDFAGKQETIAFFPYADEAERVALALNATCRVAVAA